MVIRSLLVTALLAFLIGCELTSVPPTATPEPTSEPALGDTQTRSSDGMVMVYVPAGQFERGSSDAQLDEAMQANDEHPLFAQRQELLYT